MSRAQLHGPDGIIDDGLAAVSPWGFDVASIAVPVAVYQGELDAMVPFAHGRWLADHVPGAVTHLSADHGHISLVRLLPQVLAELKALGGV